MRSVPNTGSLEKFDGATWDESIRIPPKQTISSKFGVVYKLSEYDTSSSHLDTDAELAEFMSRRLKEIDGLVFFDYVSKYKLDMPKNWDAPQKPEEKHPAQKSGPILPPDKGDMFDQVYACQQAEHLLDRCRRANVSRDSSPWTKYGGWPDKLRVLPAPPVGSALDPPPEICVIAAEWGNYCKAKVK